MDFSGSELPNPAVSTDRPLTRGPDDGKAEAAEVIRNALSLLNVATFQVGICLDSCAATFWRGHCISLQRISPSADESLMSCYGGYGLVPQDQEGLDRLWGREGVEPLGSLIVNTGVARHHRATQDPLCTPLL